MDVPDRIGKLIERIEAGETVTQKDVDRIAELQFLDLAKLGGDFAGEAVARDAKATEVLNA
jgi:hypothetical protein